MTDVPHVPTTSLWQTGWAIAGPRLPSKEIMVQPGIYLGPLTDNDFNQMKDFRAPAADLQVTSDAFVVRHPPRDVVQSRHRLVIIVSAIDEDDALAKADAIADRFVASVNLAVGQGTYAVELRAFRRAGELQEMSAWSQTTTVTPMAPAKDLPNSTLESAISLFAAIEADPIANTAYIHLLSAWQLQQTAGSKPLARSILQHYVMSIEAIVTGVMTKVRREKSDSIKLDERTFAAEFAASLAKRADKPAAIREASTELRRISLSNMLPSIEQASLILSMPSEITEHAKALYRLRSSDLSHPGRGDGEKIDNWLRMGPTVDNHCLADTVAHHFLTGYCATVQGQSDELAKKG